MHTALTRVYSAYVMASRAYTYRFPGFKHQGGVTHVALSCTGPALRRPWQDPLSHGYAKAAAAEAAAQVCHEIVCIWN